MKSFERIVRSAFKFSEQQMNPIQDHVFEIREIHPSLPVEVRRLFDNAHYAQATFEAGKYLDKVVAKLAGSSESGKSMMMKVFSETSPIIRLNSLSTESERNEQEGYRFIFAGTIVGIRNPRGHDVAVRETVSECLEHLDLISHLLRKLEKAGYLLPNV